MTWRWFFSVAWSNPVELKQVQNVRETCLQQQLTPLWCDLNTSVWVFYRRDGWNGHHLGFHCLMKHRWELEKWNIHRKRHCWSYVKSKEPPVPRQSMRTTRTRFQFALSLAVKRLPNSHKSKLAANKFNINMFISQFLYMFWDDKIHSRHAAAPHLGHPALPVTSSAVRLGFVPLPPVSKNRFRLTLRRMKQMIKHEFQRKLSEMAFQVCRDVGASRLLTSYRTCDTRDCWWPKELCAPQKGAMAEPSTIDLVLVTFSWLWDFMGGFAGTSKVYLLPFWCNVDSSSQRRTKGRFGVWNSG